MLPFTQWSTTRRDVEATIQALPPEQINANSVDSRLPGSITVKRIFRLVQMCSKMIHNNGFSRYLKVSLHIIHVRRGGNESLRNIVDSRLPEWIEIKIVVKRNSWLI